METVPDQKHRLEQLCAVMACWLMLTDSSLRDHPAIFLGQHCRPTQRQPIVADGWLVFVAFMCVYIIDDAGVQAAL